MPFTITHVGTKAENDSHIANNDAPIMKTRITETPLSGLLVVDIEYFQDERGFFVESWNKKDFAAAGIHADFVQDSHSASRYGVLRGLHYQDMRAPMGKLVRCTVGQILDVAVDLRADSPTYGKFFSIELTDKNKTLLWVPVGFAHGFATMSEYCEVQYKQTDFYSPESEGGIAWNDADIGIAWPYTDPVLSGRDQRLKSFIEYRKNPAFR
jgi:dTDP-4-dehydrorhamnose 3,5-epimerase